MLPWLSLLAVLVVAFLGWNLFRRFGADRVAALGEKRRPTSTIVSRGEFVDGSRHIEVSLALNRSTFFYENADLQGSLELHWITEVEYDTTLVTGAEVGGGRVLRLRCYSRTFEFVLPHEIATRWYMALPPRRRSGPDVPVIEPQAGLLGPALP